MARFGPGAGMAARLSMKLFFFDRKRVKDAVDEMGRKGLSKLGAFVRQRARTSMPYRKGASRPGSPPHAHTGLLRKNIWFAYDPQTKSVVVGPTPLRNFTGVPRLLEFGGMRFNPNRKRKHRMLYYRPRPYMWPAAQKEVRNFPQVFRNKLRMTRV